MSLSGYSLPVETVETQTADGVITHTVHGLSADAIAALIRAQGETMRELYKRALSGEFQASDVENLVLVLMDEAPILLALSIAYALHEPELWETAMDMPFSDQVALMDAVLRITFNREGGAKKVMEIIKRAMAQAVAQKPQQT